jgi:hypothetical protein
MPFAPRYATALRLPDPDPGADDLQLLYSRDDDARRRIEANSSAIGRVGTLMIQAIEGVKRRRLQSLVQHGFARFPKTLLKTNTKQKKNITREPEREKRNSLRSRTCGCRRPCW